MDLVLNKNRVVYFLEKMNEIDFETVLGELGCEMEKGEKGDNSQVDFMGDLIKRQRGCNIKNIKKHLVIYPSSRSPKTTKQPKETKHPYPTS